MKTLNIIFLAIILQVTTLETTFAEIIKVPEQFSEIQDAIEYSSNGDTVLVYPGTYNEKIWFKGKEILVGSLFITTNNPAYKDSTVIQYSGNNCYVVSFTWGETNLSRLVGFTLTENSGYTNIINCNHSSPTIENNIINNGRRWSIRCDNNSSPIIKQNVFNKTSSSSPSFSSIRIWDSEAIIYENIFNGPDNYYLSFNAIEIVNSEIISVSNNYIFSYFNFFSISIIFNINCS